MAPCLYPFGKPARASAARAEPEVAEPRDLSREGRVSSAPGKDAGPSSSTSTPTSSASPPSPFAHLADVWDVDTLRVAPREEAPEGGAEEAATDAPRTEAESAEAAVVAAAGALRARLLAGGAPLRGDPFSPKAQVRAARADRLRARRVFVRDPLSLEGGDIGSSESDDSEREAEPSAAAAARRAERAAARRDSKTFASVDRRDRAETHHHVFGLKLKALADAFEASNAKEAGPEETDGKTQEKEDAATARMEDVVGLFLLWCGAAFRVDAEHAAKKKTARGSETPPPPRRPRSART